jgi:hypothetical protein
MSRFVEESEAELDRERAAALGRAGAKVEERLDECRRLGEDLGPGDRSGPTLERYRAARAAAEEARWALCVQREALGLVEHHWVERLFPLPPRR